MRSEQLFGTLGALLVFVLRLLEEADDLLVAFLSRVGDVHGDRFSALQQVVAGAQKIVGDVARARVALTVVALIGRHSFTPLSKMMFETIGGFLRGGTVLSRDFRDDRTERSRAHL